MADVTYTTAAAIWRSGSVVIVSALGTRIAVFPMDFLLATCGDNTWGYVSFAVICVIDIDPQHPGNIIDDQGHPVDLEAVPFHGTFCYSETGMSEATFV